jgi:SAM-dependent methyltransferase
VDIRAYNRLAWNREVERGNQWTVPVSSQAIAAARQGQWEIVLTPTKPVPRAWFPDLEGLEVLCLVAERDGLTIATVEGDMADLSMFADHSFHLVVHPVSNVFVPDVRPVWAEAFRVLRPGGALLSGFTNPVVYIFDQELVERGVFEVKYALPYSDLTSLTEEERQRYIDQEEPLEFGHTLEDQIGGQLDAGFVITGFYEDYAPEEALSNYTPTFIATRAVKPEV